MTQANNNETWLFPLFRVAGYALLALSLLDIINILIPPGFTNPAWEFQLVGNLVERSPVPLLGIVLVLVGENNFRIFQFLSRASLVAGILFLLLLPLAINSVWRIEQQSNQQLIQQTAQLQYFRSQISQATTAQQINDVLTRLNPQANTPEIKNPQQFKDQLLEKIATAEKRMKTQAANENNSNFNLNKSAVKSSLGSLISGAFFLMIWRKTAEVINSQKRRMRINGSLTPINE